MTAAILCYVLVAVLLCTVHLFLGIWIGHEIERGWRQIASSNIEQVITQCRDRVAESAALRSDAHKLSEACARHESQLPVDIVRRALSLAQAADSWQTKVEAMNQLMSVLRPRTKRAAVSKASAQVVRPKPTQGITVASTSGLERFRYEVWQHVALFNGEQLPPDESFERVLCRDLSSSGFSYYSEELPSCDTLIVALGSPPDLRFFVSKVVSSPPVTRQDQVGYLVECHFVRKLAKVYVWDETLGRIASTPASPALLSQIT